MKQSKIIDDLIISHCRIRDAFSISTLNGEFKQNLIEEIEKLRSENKNVRFAVRSSGLTEDGEDTSTAGQNDTFLGLRTNEDISESVIKCWSSLFTLQSVSYRM